MRKIALLILMFSASANLAKASDLDENRNCDSQLSEAISGIPEVISGLTINAPEELICHQNSRFPSEISFEEAFATALEVFRYGSEPYDSFTLFNMVSDYVWDELSEDEMKVAVEQKMLSILNEGVISLAAEKSYDPYGTVSHVKFGEDLSQTWVFYFTSDFLFTETIFWVIIDRNTGELIDEGSAS